MKKFSTPPPPRCKFTAAVAVATFLPAPARMTLSGWRLRLIILMAGGFFNTIFPLIKGGEGDLFAQAGLWQASGGSIVYTNRNVGILTNNPSAAFDVNGRTRTRGNAVFDSSAIAFSMMAQQAEFATALVTGNFSAGSLTVSGNATVNGQLSVVSGQLMLGSNLSMDGNNSTITSPSGNISLGNNNLNTTGNINSANISALQATDSIFSSQISLLTTQDSILNSQVSSIQSSQWTTTQNGIEHNGNVFVKNLSVEESINIGSFRFSNGSKDTAIAPPPVIKDTIASDKPIVISAEKNISLSADTVLLGNGTGKVGIGIPPAPGEKLSVAGNVGVSGNLRLSNLSGTDERLLYVDSSGNLKVNPLTAGDAWVTDGNAISNGDFIGTTNSNDFIIKTNNQERIRIIGGVMYPGNVGIGTSNPQKRLHVWQTGNPSNPSCAASLRLEYDNDPTADGCTTAQSTWDLNAQGNNEFTITTPALPQPVMTFLGNGRVGIGTNNPQERLDVNGNAVFSDKVYINTTPNNIIGPHHELNVCGTIHSKEVTIETTTWCDFKLKPRYKRMTWQEKLAYIETFGHLPEMDSGLEIETNGLKVSKVLYGFIWNIEDNTMDIIDLQKENKEQKQKIEELEKESQQQKEAIAQLKKEMEQIKEKK